MSSGPLRPEVKLGVELSAIMSRNMYTTDPAPVIEQLHATAGARPDILAKEVGTWIGFYETDRNRAALIAALRTLPDLDEWIALGRRRADDGRHTTQGFGEPGTRYVLPGS
jgi:hypothetical protein